MGIAFVEGASCASGEGDTGASDCAVQRVQFPQLRPVWKLVERCTYGQPRLRKWYDTTTTRQPDYSGICFRRELVCGATTGGVWRKAELLSSRCCNDPRRRAQRSPPLFCFGYTFNSFRWKRPNPDSIRDKC